jgi:hypothetical protein
MNLRLLAARDLARILSDGAAGFGWPVEITAPDGSTLSTTGFTNDIGQVFDPGTGQPIAGRHVSFTIPEISFAEVGMLIPAQVTARGAPKWIFKLDDVNGTPGVFTVRSAMRDRSAGTVVLVLEVYVE